MFNNLQNFFIGQRPYNDNRYYENINYPEISISFPLQNENNFIENYKEPLDIYPQKYNSAFKSKECSICQTDFQENEKISILTKCDHMFHYKCLKEWSIHKPTCPLCRKTIPVLER